MMFGTIVIAVLAFLMGVVIGILVKIDPWPSKDNHASYPVRHNYRYDSTSSGFCFDAPVVEQRYCGPNIAIQRDPEGPIPGNPNKENNDAKQE